jgi:hypothetical protein
MAEESDKSPKGSAGAAASESPTATTWRASGKAATTQSQVVTTETKTKVKDPRCVEAGRRLAKISQAAKRRRLEADGVSWEREESEPTIHMQHVSGKLSNSKTSIVALLRKLLKPKIFPITKCFLLNKLKTLIRVLA